MNDTTTAVAVAAFERFANELLDEPDGQTRLIEHVKNNGAPVDIRELLETLEAPRGAVLRLMFRPMPDGTVMMMAARMPSK